MVEKITCSSFYFEIMGKLAYATWLIKCRNAICSDRMTKLARLSARWIGNHGFSIGIEDVTPSDRLKHEKKILVEKAYADCDALLEDFKTGMIQAAMPHKFR